LAGDSFVLAADGVVAVAKSSISLVATLPTMTAAPITSPARFSPFGPLGIISPVLRKPLILGFIFLVDHGPDVIIQVANFGFQLGFGEALTFGGNDKIVG
jgi:hypothetical protein